MDEPGNLEAGFHRLGDFVNGEDRWWSTEDRHVSRVDREMMNLQRVEDYGDEEQTIAQIVDGIGDELGEFVFRPLGFEFDAS